MSDSEFTDPVTMEGHTFQNIRAGTCRKCGEYHWDGYLCMVVKRSLGEQIAWAVRDLEVFKTADALSQLKREELERILEMLLEAKK